MLDLDSLAEQRAAVMRQFALLTQGITANTFVSEMFIGIYARHALPELIAICERWQPDVIVREENEFAGAIAAEHLGLPHAAVQVVFGASRYRSPTAMPDVVRRLDELRAAWGLPADPDLAMLYRHLYLSFDPPSLLDTTSPAPSTLRHLRTDVFDRSSDETLPEWFNPNDGRPLIYVTLGSEAANLPGIFPDLYGTLLAGLREADATIVMTTGRKHDPTALGPQPDHIHVERYIPQSLLLPRADLVVTHGGHNTVLAALQHGLPMVITPLFADQFDNARRCVELGVAQVIDGAGLTSEAVQRAVHGVLGATRYRENARWVQAEIRSLPPVEHGVRLLEQLVTEWVPLPVRAAQGVNS
jgi:UDP:flavonoid glycosyltransferase YjiC (YdhE family)